MMRFLATTQATTLRRLTLTMLAGAFVFALSPASAFACANEDIEPVTAEEITAAEFATHCLINQIRVDNGLRRVRWNTRLRRSSAWQANDMLEYGYFGHERTDGPDFERRILRFGYARRSNGYSLGENIAWSTAPEGTPSSMIESWMDSPGHRENILRKVFRDEGISILRSEGETEGEYADYGPVLIYVNQFGKRY
ncbi:MAG: hypothetical protein JHC87_04480 [Thermoleophilaceae bacterium]|nr:hypothetical protein [Thermoleophilaceae bacterium]